MKRSLVLSAFVVVAIVQLLAPASMIIQREMTLRHGQAYKFRTAPVDPYDAFRGRYVWLAYEQNHARWYGVNPGLRGSAYAQIQEGNDGFAVINLVAMSPPKAGDYVKVDRLYPDWRTNSVVHFDLPFDRYYMEETAAPKAERAYWEHNRRGQTNHNTYAVVRIKDGNAVLENLYVDGRPIAEFVQQNSK
jgi:uncharacterized membrane-anchored protein